MMCSGVELRQAQFATLDNTYTRSLFEVTKIYLLFVIFCVGEKIKANCFSNRLRCAGKSGVTRA